MPNLPGAFSDTFEQLGQTAKQTSKQLKQVPKDLFETGKSQVAGSSNDDDKGQAAEYKSIEPVAAAGSSKAGSGQQKPAQPQLTPQQQLEIKKKEDRERSMARYRQIQEALVRYRQKKTQETPAYITGKPGEPETEQERADLWQKQQKEAEEAKKQQKVSLPGQKGGTKGVGERLKGVSG